MRSVSTLLLGAGLLLLGACGGGEEAAPVENAADTTVIDDEGVLEPVNAADAADVTPAEANAVDNAIDAALDDGNAAVNGQ